MNKVILMGRLTKDPEVRYAQSNEPLAVARYTLAVNRRFKRAGEQDADFIGCVAFGKTGEFAEKYFKKGQMVGVVGRLQVRSWDDNEGKKHWTTKANLLLKTTVVAILPPKLPLLHLQHHNPVAMQMVFIPLMKASKMTICLSNIIKKRRLGT